MTQGCANITVNEPAFAVSAHCPRSRCVPLPLKTTQATEKAGKSVQNPLTQNSKCGRNRVGLRLCKDQHGMQPHGPSPNAALMPALARFICKIQHRTCEPVHLPANYRANHSQPPRRLLIKARNGRLLTRG
jgi:hypothetical protein